MSPETAPDRWLALLEAVLASPVRRTIVPKGLPAGADEETLKTVRQAMPKVPALGPLLGEAPSSRPPPPPPPRRPPAPPAATAAPTPASDAPTAPTPEAAAAPQAAPQAGVAPEPEAAPAPAAEPPPETEPAPRPPDAAVDAGESSPGPSSVE
jgi:hypothetical protein